VFVQNASSVPDVCCKRFDLDVSYVLYICCNRMFQMFHLFQSSVAASVFMLQVASVLFGCWFHTYVVSVSSICFICFKRMLHSSVSCCTSFILFEESGATGSDGGTARALRNRARRVGAGKRGVQRTGVLRMGRARGRRSGPDGCECRVGRTRAGCKCEVSPPDTKTLQWGGMRLRGGKNQRTEVGCVGVRTLGPPFRENVQSH